MEQFTKFVSSRGILRSCNIHDPSPVSGSTEVALPGLADDNYLFDTIYVCADAILHFIEHSLPIIYRPFVLVTGDSILAITHELCGDPRVQPLLQSKLLFSWYAQNCAVDHPKIFKLPLGMDYHTMWQKPNTWGLGKQSPVAQEYALLKVLSGARDFQQRIFGGYCNWHFEKDRGDRVECLNEINRKLCFFEKYPLPRLTSWTRQAEFMFVISPEGKGLDCHRTWEAIILGCIPVMKKSKISSLFENLPIIELNDWTEYQQGALMIQRELCMQKKYDYSSLFLNYWKAKIGLTRVPTLPKMTMNEFKHFLVNDTY